MARIINSLVVLALASMFAGVSARRDLYDYCRDLSKMMADNLLIFTDAREAYKEASGHLRSIFNVGSDRWKLASAWKAVVNDQPCDEKSADHVWIIYDCAPQVDKELVTLNKAVGSYANKCLTPEFWDKELRETLGKEDETGLSEFLSDKFIDKYHELNPTETKVFFGSTNGPNCCHVMRSMEALFDTIELVPDTKDIDELLYSDSDDLVGMLKQRLITPCYDYHDNLGTLMMKLKRVGLHHEKGEQEFIDQLSPTLKNAIFRYEYCVSIIFPNRLNAN